MVGLTENRTEYGQECEAFMAGSENGTTVMGLKLNGVLREKDKRHLQASQKNLEKKDSKRDGILGGVKIKTVPL